MAAPAFAATFGHAGNPTTAPAVTLGTTAANDILIAVVVNGGAINFPTLGGTYNGPAWQAVDSGTWTTGGGGVYWSRASGNHTGQTVTASTTDSGSLAVIRVTGAVTSGSPFAGITGATVAPDDGTLAGFTPTANECLICLAVALDDNATWTATQGGVTMTERAEITSTGGTDTMVGLATTAQATATATGTFAVTQAAGVAAHGKRLSAFAIAPEPPILIGTLTDDFADNSIDSAKWTVTAGVAETGGRMVITPTSSYPYFRTASLNYTLADSSMFTKIPVLPTGAATAFTFRDDANSNGWYMERNESGMLGMYERVAGVSDYTEITFNATDHLWWRMRHSSGAGLIYWETSPDGSTWTTRRSKAPGIPLGTYRAYGFSGGATPTGTAEFESFNVVESSGTPKAGADAATTSESSLVIFAVNDDDDLTLVTENVVVILSEYARSDSFSMTDSPASSVAQESKAVTEGYILTEAVPSLSQSRSVTEAYVLTDAGTVAATLSSADAMAFAESLGLSQTRTTTDASTLTDSAVFSSLQTLSVVDTLLWTETNALSALLSRVDSNALIEALSIAASVGLAEQITWEDVSTVTSNAFLVGSDSAIQLDAATVLSILALMASDQLTIAESSLMDAAVAAVDSAVQAEARALSVSLSRTDALAVTDSAELVRTLAAVGADSMSVSELAGVAGALQGSDEAALDELGTLSSENAIEAFDSLVWLGEQALVGAGGLAADISLPTRAAVVAWAATVVLTAIDLGVETSLHQATVELAGNIKSVSTAPSKTSVAISPNRTSVSLG